MNPQNTTKKILITGAAGYIGSILVPYLLRQGHQITAVDNFMYGQTSLITDCIEDRLIIVRGDVRDKELMCKLIAGCDCVIPLACLVGAPVCDKKPDEARAINLEAIKMLLAISSRHQPFIMPTTNSGYGIGQSGAFCTEGSPLNPISLYGRLKVEAEKHILDSGHGISLRLATAFGLSPRMRLDLLVNDFTYRAVTDRFIVLFEAHFKRNYIHVRDIARAFSHALVNFSSMQNNAFNVGLSDANLSKLELCQEIQKQIPDFTFLEAKIGKDPDQRDYIVSNAKIEKTGFKPLISLPQGISELIKGYQIIRQNQFSNV
ncbi:MAG: NAD(P)-dependent oxidoreductase [Kiritimatiellia bacterium]|nr:NAD(P)-dependent oxidoreductase [Kiritimatiellia bacterium]